MTETDTPTILVKVGDGKRQNRVDLSHKILSFQYTDSEKKSDELRLTVDNFDIGEGFDNPIWRKGNIIECTWGVAGAMSPLRHVCIHSTKGANPLTVVAKGGLTFMNEVVKSETYEDARDSDVVREIVTRNGWSDEAVQFIQDTEDEPRIITQPRLTDAQMLRRLAKRNGYVVFVDFDGFHFHKRDISAQPVRELIYYTDPGKGDILDINIENDIMARPKAVRVSGRDPDKKKTVTGGGTNTTAAEDPRASRILDGYETAEKALQKFEDAYISTNFPGALPTLYQIIGPLAFARAQSAAYYPRPLGTEAAQEEVERQAKQKFTMAQQGVVKLTMTLRGDAFILAKTTFMLRGVGKRLSGKYYIKEAVHSLSGNGAYTVAIKAISDGTDGFRREPYDGFLDTPSKGRTGTVEIVGTRLLEGENGELLSVGISPVGVDTSNRHVVYKDAGKKGRPFPNGVKRNK